MELLSYPRLCTAILRLVLFFITSRRISSSLISAPLAFENGVMQCGCRNTLDALSPDPSLPRNQTPIAIDLTAFFYFNTVNSSNCVVERENNAMPTSHLIPAAVIALDEINNSSDLLKGYHLQLAVRDSRCDATHAISQLIDSIADRLKGIQPPDSPYNLGIIGPGCEAVTGVVAGVIDRSLKLPVVSYGNPPATKNRGERSTLFHTSRSVLLSMRSAIRLLRHFNWTNNIAFISETSDLFISTVEEVIETDINDRIVLKDSSGGIPVSQFSKIENRNNEITSSLLQFVNVVREKNIRVIVGLLSQRSAAQLICTARSGIIPGDGFVYVFIGVVGDFFENWWKTESEYCNLTDLDVQSTFLVTGDVINPDTSAILKSGRTVQDFNFEFSQRLTEWCSEESNYNRRFAESSAGSLYDAVWALALALNESVDLINSVVDRELHYDSDLLGRIVESLELTDFVGVTGELHFVNGEHGGAEFIQQVQDGDQVVVATHFKGDLTASKDNLFVWNGSSNVVPRDQVLVIQKNVPIYWIVIVLIFTIAGMVFGICMLIFNWYYGRHKILLASSQRLNYIIIVGVFFGFFTVVILSILNSPLGLLMSDDLYKTLCLIRIWMLPLSFTYTYGIMFARAWRIYKIFNDPWRTSRPYKDYHLLTMVMVAAAVDVAILIPWTIIDPYRRFPSDVTVSYESYTQCEFSNCSSDNAFVWLAVLAVYKLLFIMVGILVISLVRQGIVKRKIFDDSKSLATAVYLVSSAFVVGLPATLLLLLAGQPLFSFLVSALWVNISSSGTLICIFLPKFYKIKIKKDSGKNYKTGKSVYYYSNYRKSERAPLPQAANASINSEDIIEMEQADENADFNRMEQRIDNVYLNNHVVQDNNATHELT